MPNWCRNVLTVTGVASEVDQFILAAKGAGELAEEALSFESTVPLGTWEYSHAIAAWGTKWDVSGAQFDRVSPGSARYQFDTAWSPPFEWLTATAKLFPLLSFRLWYAEGGMDFAGVFYAEGDEASDTELNFIDAHLEEFGEFNASCSVDGCYGDVMLVSKDDLRICDDCLRSICANCDGAEADHVDSKCLFTSTVFVPLCTKYGVYFDLEGKRVNGKTGGE